MRYIVYIFSLSLSLTIKDLDFNCIPSALILNGINGKDTNHETILT